MHKPVNIYIIIYLHIFFLFKNTYAQQYHIKQKKITIHKIYKNTGFFTYIFYKINEMWIEYLKYSLNIYKHNILL